MVLPADSRMGALTGCAVRLAAAIPDCQSLESTRETASGPGMPPVDGKAASATPAAFATGSAPATRVVFLVANSGKPRSWTALGCGAFFVCTTIFGAGGGGACFDSFVSAWTRKYTPTPMPQRASNAVPPIATRRFENIHTARNGIRPAPARRRFAQATAVDCQLVD